MEISVENRYESRDCAWFTYRTVELRHWWEHRKNKLSEPQSEPMNVKSHKVKPL